MATTWTSAADDIAITARVTDLVSGFLDLQDASNNVLATFTLDSPAGTVTGRVWTLAFVSGSVTASGGGAGTNCTKARLRTSGGTERCASITVTASGGGGEIQLDNISIATGQTVTLTSATMTYTPA